jgi:hypothetical protein
MRPALVMALLCGAAAALAACGDDASEPTAPLPPSGVAYRALGDAQRLEAAERCRDGAAAGAGDMAAAQLRDIDAAALRTELDSAYRLKREQRRPVAEVCAERLPFVTPGLRLRFEGAEDSGDAYTYETESDIPLGIRGTVSPAPREGTVVARREFGGSRAVSGTIDPGGGFALPEVRLRKVADNSFVVTIDAPPNALRKVHFSAICLDCLAAGQPPGD